MAQLPPVFRRLRRPLRRGPLPRLLATLTATIVSAAVVLYVVLAYPLASDPRLVPAPLQRARHILLVTAHPDDETLFFSPTILYHRQHPEVTRALLALSSGNYNGLGDVRQDEIHRSCDRLGIARERCIVLDRGELQDNPKAWWDEDLIREQVAQYVQQWQIDLLYTFDDGGVSGHINHRAVSAGVRKFIHTTPNAPPVYMLQSTFLLRKYASLIDLPRTALPFAGRILRALMLSPQQDPSLAQSDRYEEAALLVSSWETYRVARAAFAQHASQYSWDRVLYLVVSRYMWYNNLVRMR
ncbi:PIG-L family deacetylase [Aspergillus saccharolyticus JOP 1030-1]|uniref:N-acetylglucosaminylphosphatidylinositol deacetylase n=1 Tax=Aspergillus saccharolyticus JOP 1030-1 TaxID=1450539 RepID=A0A318ZGW6_9EURO|nr:glycan biosynthesis protein [Aspergillus saccharolyticus JOP 1030-1]PYH42910.1 glycan biosynthesis protein [Aspergillus saccharolyticus JOP 1030-1]